MTVVKAIRGFFSIPAGTKPVVCTCGKTIYWIEHRCKPKRIGEEGKLSKLPIAVQGDVRAEAPTNATVGMGFNHFIDCPDREKHRRGAARV